MTTRHSASRFAGPSIAFLEAPPLYRVRSGASVRIIWFVIGALAAVVLMGVF